MPVNKATLEKTIQQLLAAEVLIDPSEIPDAKLSAFWLGIRLGRREGFMKGFDLALDCVSSGEAPEDAQTFH